MAAEDRSKEPTGQDLFFFEMELDETGLLREYERSGIIPDDTPPNPYHPEDEEEKHNEWWEDHPSEAARYTANVEARETALKNLYKLARGRRKN